MKKANIALLAVLFSAGAFAGPIIRQDFENTKFFKAQNQSAVSGNDQDANGLWTGFRPDFAIVKANSAFSSGRQALQISRLETGHSFFTERKNMPQYTDREYTFSFDFKPGVNGSSCFGFRLINSADNSEAAQFHFLKDNVLSDRYGNKTKFKVVPGKWQQITFKFIPNEKWLNVTLKTEDGEVLTSGGVKLVKFQAMDKINFFLASMFPL